MVRAVFIALFLAAVVRQGDSHGYKKPERKEPYDNEEKTEEESEFETYGFEECEDWVRPHEVNSKLPQSIALACGRYECPEAPVQESDGCGYLTRYIPKAHWISTELDFSVPDPLREAYIRLQRYRSKNNDAGVRIPSTRPTVTWETLDADGNVVGAKMSMYVSSEFQDVPPASTDPLVIIEQWPDYTVYSRSYGGYLEDELFDEQFGLLEEALSNQGVEVDESARIKVSFTYHRYGSQRTEAMLIGR